MGHYLDGSADRFQSWVAGKPQYTLTTPNLSLDALDTVEPLYITAMEFRNMSTENQPHNMVQVNLGLKLFFIKL